jgi:hypothetical protein
MFLQSVLATSIETRSFNKHHKLSCVDGFGLNVYEIKTQWDICLKVSRKRLFVLLSRLLN